MKIKINLFAVFAALVVLFSVPVMAQEVLDIAQVQKELEEKQKEIDGYEALFTQESIDDDILIENRQTLKDLQGRLNTLAGLVKPFHTAAQADLHDLGPVPEGENAALEPENITTLRKQLSDKALMAEGVVRQSEAAQAKVSRLLERLAALRRGQFVNQVLENQTPPFDTALWALAHEAHLSLWTVAQKFTASFLKKADNDFFISLAVAILVWIGMAIAAMRVSGRWFKDKLSSAEEDNRFSVVARAVFLGAGVSILGLFIIYQTLDAQTMLSALNQTLTLKVFSLTAFLLFIMTLTAKLSAARIIRPSMRWLSVIAAFLYVTDALWLESGRVVGTPLELAIGQSYIVTSLFAVVLVAFSLSILRQSPENYKFFLPRQIFFGFVLLAVFILASNIFGYAALGRYIFERLILLFALFAFLLLVRTALRPYLCKLDSLFRHNGKDDQNSEERLIFFWLSLSLDIILFLVSLPVLAGIVGAEWQDIQDWALQAFFGFKVGAITISIANIGIAVGLFFVLLFVTGLLQKVLGQKILPKTKMEESIRQSITQVLGYVGLIIALMAGISAVGFDLTNLALIAGALSVGIGFGLQSIVSNFVSGLILLFERPIKTGDWIITNSGEGIVKKISVRATEIETFDRTSIIVPNSELIASSVKNWTHKDKIGRVIIPVGVSYNADPNKVHDILLECANARADVLENPAPSIYFKDFGDSALLFDLRVFIKNISDVYKIGTQLRFDIWNALKQNGVEIPFPQRDLHIKTAEGLKGVIDGK